jgi:hypothetical protein
MYPSWSGSTSAYTNLSRGKLAMMMSKSFCRYTFPSESRIDQDPHGLGKRVYETLVKRLIEQGTTMAALYGTIGVEAK